MQVDRLGSTMAPRRYKGWRAELTGDDADSGGIYAFLFSSNGQDKATFWDTDREALEEQFRGGGIVINWEDSLTLQSFLSDSNLSKKLTKQILANMYERSETEMVFNLTQLEFLFENSTVILSYFIVDEKYPELKLSFIQLENLLLEYLRK